MNTLQLVAAKLSGASDYMDVFGSPAAATPPNRHVKVIYRQLAKFVYPDLYSETDDHELAQEAFKSLGKFKKQADDAIGAGTYGRVAPNVTFTTRRGRHEVIRPVAGGHIAATYWTMSTIQGVRQPSFCKVAKHPRDNDLLQNEAAALKRLHGDDAENQWKRHVPQLLDAFIYQDKSGRRRANAITRLEGFYTLEQVKQAFPDGIDPLHAVWMFRRVLMALGFAHDNYIMHGAVVPSHVMILPERHGVVLVDWCYASVGDGGEQPPIGLLAKGYHDWYPEEVLAKRPPSPATDIAMAVRCMIDVLGGQAVAGNLPLNVPQWLRAYLKGCLQSKQPMRPQNAWLLLEEFDELLKTMGAPYYPRRFINFAMPPGVA